MVLMKAILFIFLFLSFPLFADEYQWNLQITTPDFDLINTPLTDKEYKPFLKKNGWRCWFGKTQLKNAVSLKEVKCDFSIKKAGQFISVLSCSKERPYGELLFDLYDERKDITHKIMLTCRKK